MYDLNEFLKGFGGYENIEVKDPDNPDKTIKKLSAKMAIDDMPPPDSAPVDVRGRQSPEDYFIGYRKKYAGLLMKVVGIYQRAMIDTVKGGGY